MSKKKKKKMLNLYVVFIEYYGGFSNSGFVMGSYNLPFKIGGKRNTFLTIVAYSKSEAVRKAHEILEYSERPYEIAEVKKAKVKKDSVKEQKVSKRKKKHKNKKLSSIYTPKKSKSARKVKWISF